MAPSVTRVELCQPLSCRTREDCSDLIRKWTDGQIPTLRDLKDISIRQIENRSCLL